jgi:hypothetical protein
MSTNTYKKKVEHDLIKEFLDKFYDQVGYYPTILTNKKDEGGIKILTLSQLETYFEQFIPTIHNKKPSMSSKNRVRPLVELRFTFFFIARQMRYTLIEIAKHLGKRDHSTVIHGLRTFKNLYETDDKFRFRYNTIINNIKKDHEPSTMEYLNQMEIKPQSDIFSGLLSE